MGKIDFSQIRPQAPLEALVGASAVARGIYLFIVEVLGKTAVVTTNSALYNIIIGTLFFVSGCFLVYGALRDLLPLRFVGLVLVVLGTAWVVIKSIMVLDFALLPLITGNLTILGLSIGLLWVLLREGKT